LKEPINIFWFKRDLRLLDNEPLNNASKLWRIKSDPKVKEESSRILQKHTNANRKAFDD